MDEIDLLASSAPAGVERSAPAAFVIDVVRPDGSTERFTIEVHSRGGVLSVRETGGRFPEACPERHLNPGGFFCLGWSPFGSSGPRTEQEREEWWERVRGFLFLQLIAESTGEWPAQYAWPHGEAARYQNELETLASGQLWITEAAESGQFVLQGTRNRVSRRSQCCPCGASKNLRDCHEADLARAIHLVQKRRDSERDFWRAWPKKVCCGTMNNCNLARTT